MIYAAQVKKVARGLTFNNGKCDDTILAFRDLDAFTAHQERLWEGSRFEGYNLVLMTYAEVQGALKSRRVEYSSDSDSIVPTCYVVSRWHSQEWRDYDADYYQSEGLRAPRYFTSGEIAGMSN